MPDTRPTDAELAILQVLWSEGPATVRDVHESLGTATGYTTTLKLLQIMAAKGLVRRDDRQRSHIYEAAVDERTATSGLVRDLIDKAFEGSAARLVLRALQSKPADPSEIAEIRALLATLEEADP